MTTVFKQVGPYRIERQIGHGGMAVVFLAVDTRLDRLVALKLVQHATDGEAREIVDAETFGAELQKQFSERGAHVPAVYEYGVDEDCGYFYVAMEYLDGENLSELITRGALPAKRAVDIAIELARFLDDAHAFEAVINGRNLQSLLHLDLKPRNVRITSSQQVKVLDFGTAKALSLTQSKVNWWLISLRTANSLCFVRAAAVAWAIVTLPRPGARPHGLRNPANPVMKVIIFSSCVWWPKSVWSVIPTLANPRCSRPFPAPGRRWRHIRSPRCIRSRALLNTPTSNGSPFATCLD
jgi:serine/threonine protein kinase